MADHNQKIKAETEAEDKPKISHEERLHLLDEHRAKKAVIIDKGTEQEALSYVRQTGASAAALRSVRCPVQGYTHLTAVYNLSVPFRKRRELPMLEEKRPEETEADYNPRYEAWLSLLPAWMAVFVVRVEGWDLVDLDDKPLPPPSRTDTEAYSFLWQNNEILATWIAFDGYTQALADSAKN